jgi:hypothetical protein
VVFGFGGKEEYKRGRLGSVEYRPQIISPGWQTVVECDETRTRKDVFMTALQSRGQKQLERGAHYIRGQNVNTGVTVGLRTWSFWRPFVLTPWRR